MVAMKPVVEGMGLDWSSQHAKVMRHPVLSKGMQHIAILSTGRTACSGAHHTRGTFPVAASPS
ncbi:phage antirepressor N-terminal domain-containing protein [Azospirillum palustre]